MKKVDKNFMPFILVAAAFFVIVLFLMTNSAKVGNKTQDGNQNGSAETTTVTGDIDVDLNQIDSKINGINPEDFDAGLVTEESFN